MSDQLSSSVLKPLVHRLRPCNNEAVKNHLRMVIAAGGGFSFVSSHAANHFALAFFYPQLFPKQKRWLMIVMMLWAAVISLSQVYIGYHYPSDVLCGAFLGLLCSGTVYYFSRNKIQNLQPE
jgi:membrane-associated phospholipid phosphatase